VPLRPKCARDALVPGAVEFGCRLLSHAETNNPNCSIAACGAALENWRSLAAFTQRRYEHFVCLARCSLGTHVEGAHARDAWRSNGTW